MTDTLRCASCGRLDGPRPEGADSVVAHDGKRYCSWCAAVRESPSGCMSVQLPSPGCMTDSGSDDPLAAWNDCYNVKPKKRILKEVAKAEVQRAWRDWSGDKRSSAAKPLFYSWLCRHRPYFMTFRTSGDRWQDIMSWIVQCQDGRTDDPKSNGR